jgi:glycosyltransferase involved in cell wall biosynthesis
MNHLRHWQHAQPSAAEAQLQGQVNVLATTPGAQAAAAGAAVVRLPFNVGIGAAAQTGFVYALERGYEYIAQVDGDGQHEPAELSKLIEAMRANPGVDMVCGSRFLTDDHRYPAPVSRRTGIHLFAFALSAIIDQRVTDPTSGLKTALLHVPWVR